MGRVTNPMKICIGIYSCDISSLYPSIKLPFVCHAHLKTHALFSPLEQNLDCNVDCFKVVMQNTLKVIYNTEISSHCEVSHSDFYPSPCTNYTLLSSRVLVTIFLILFIDIGIIRLVMLVSLATNFVAES